MDLAHRFPYRAQQAVTLGVVEVVDLIRDDYLVVRQLAQQADKLISHEVPGRAEEAECQRNDDQDRRDPTESQTLESVYRRGKYKSEESRQRQRHQDRASPKKKTGNHDE